MKKQIISSILALAMIASLGVTAFATEVTAPGNATTAVTYNGTSTDSYVVTIPSTMSAGSSATVTAEGTWASNKKLVVTAEESVTMYSEIDTSARKELAVTFEGISQVGNNGSESSASADVTVAEMTGIALGNWNGEFEFTIELENYILYGDVNFDGHVNTTDSTLVSRYVAEWEDYSLTEAQKLAADVDLDGDVTSIDVSIISKHVSGEAGYETLPYVK